MKHAVQDKSILFILVVTISLGFIVIQPFISASVNTDNNSNQQTNNSYQTPSIPILKSHNSNYKTMDTCPSLQCSGGW